MKWIPLELSQVFCKIWDLNLHFIHLYYLIFFLPSPLVNPYALVTMSLIGWRKWVGERIEAWGACLQPLGIILELSHWPLLVMLGEKFQPLDIMLGRNPLMGIFLSTVYFLVQAHFKKWNRHHWAFFLPFELVKNRKGFELSFCLFRALVQTWKRRLSELLRLFTLGSNMKSGWANFYVFSRSGSKYEKTVERSFYVFPALDQNMKNGQAIFLRFFPLWI
jgi:hypothetical protein